MLSSRVTAISYPRTLEGKLRPTQCWIHLSDISKNKHCSMRNDVEKPEYTVRVSGDKQTSRYQRFMMFSLITYLVSLPVILCVIQALYRLYLHPLAKFPGPKFAAITEFWELYQDFFRKESGYLFLELDKLHGKYGRFKSSMIVLPLRNNELKRL